MNNRIISLPSSTDTFDIVPLTLVYFEEATFKDTYGGDMGMVALAGYHYKPKVPSDTVLISMHPIGGTGRLPVMRYFAEQGVHVIGADSRYRGVDNALIMEKVVMDLGAFVKHAKEELGYKRIILLGWSGGGSLSAFYQSQAESPSVTSAPCGMGPDLTSAGLIPADALVFMAAHVSRHGTLTESLDPSITDETDPYTRDPDLDIYSGDIAPPFTPEFLERYRAAQVARNRRITAWVKEKLAWLRASGRENEEFAFTVHGTGADPRWLDATLDPNDREPGTSFLGDPKIVNMGPVGLARACTLRSWLSQWSYDDANADGPKCVAKISKPIMVVSNTADNICSPSHARRFYDAIAHDEKAYRDIKGATHYYIGQQEQGLEATGAVRDWLQQQGLL